MGDERLTEWLNDYLAGALDPEALPDDFDIGGGDRATLQELLANEGLLTVAIAHAKFVHVLLSAIQSARFGTDAPEPKAPVFVHTAPAEGVH